MLRAKSVTHTPRLMWEAWLDVAPPRTWARRGAAGGAGIAAGGPGIVAAAGRAAAGTSLPVPRSVAVH